MCPFQFLLPRKVLNVYVKVENHANDPHNCGYSFCFCSLPKILRILQPLPHFCIGSVDGLIRCIW